MLYLHPASAKYALFILMTLSAELQQTTLLDLAMLWPSTFKAITGWQRNGTTIVYSSRHFIWDAAAVVVLCSLPVPYHQRLPAWRAPCENDIRYDTNCVHCKQSVIVSLGSTALMQQMTTMHPSWVNEHTANAVRFDSTCCACDLLL